MVNILYKCAHFRPSNHSNCLIPALYSKINPGDFPRRFKKQLCRDLSHKLFKHKYQILVQSNHEELSLGDWFFHVIKASHILYFNKCICI